MLLLSTLIDSGDVEEVILVIVGEITFHLGRIHAAIGLSHIDRRFAYLRKDVHGHSLNGQKRK